MSAYSQLTFWRLTADSAKEAARMYFEPLLEPKLWFRPLFAFTKWTQNHRGHLFLGLFLLAAFSSILLAVTMPNQVLNTFFNSADHLTADDLKGSAFLFAGLAIVAVCIRTWREQFRPSLVGVVIVGVGLVVGGSFIIAHPGQMVIFAAGVGAATLAFVLVAIIKRS